MNGFFADLLAFDFLRNALIAGLLISVACGLVGTLVVTKRITYLAGAIAHSVLGGMGAAGYLAKVHGMTWLTPLLGALIAALISAGIVGWVNLRAKERADTVIGAIWAIGMALGVLFIAKTPGYSEDLMSYLFGNILMVSGSDLWLIALLDAAVVAISLLLFHKLLAVCFDEQHARLRGIWVEGYTFLLLGLTALTVVLLVTIVGIVMVIALLTLPAAIAGHFTKTLARMMALAVALCAAMTTGGLAISYGPDLPAGATIIVLAGAVYLAVVILHRKSFKH
jgi:zinc transport system permease protein